MWRFALLGSKVSMGGGSSEFFQVPGPLYREKGIYDESHLVSLSASLYLVPDPIERDKLGIFQSPSAYMGGELGIFQVQGFFDMFHVFTETSSLWRFSHVPWFSNREAPPPPPEMGLRKILRSDMYIYLYLYLISKFAKHPPPQGKSSTDHRGPTRREADLTPVRTGFELFYRDLEKFRGFFFSIY